MSKYSVILMRQLSSEHPTVPTATFDVDTPKIIEAHRCVAHIQRFCEKFVEFKNARWYIIVIPRNPGELDVTMTYEEIVLSHFDQRALWP